MWWTYICFFARVREAARLEDLGQVRDGLLRVVCHLVSAVVSMSCLIEDGINNATRGLVVRGRCVGFKDSCCLEEVLGDQSNLGAHPS